MEKKSNRKESTNLEEVVRMNIPMSDLLYCRFRKELLGSAEKLESQQESNITSSGIILLSTKFSELTYNMDTSSFGSLEDIINTLTFTLLKKLKDSTASDKKSREKVLITFMDFFVQEAKEEFFGDDDFEYDDEYDEDI